MKNSLKALTVLCVALFFLASFSGTVFADETENEETPSGTETYAAASRLSYDKAANKQFITVEDRDGNTFYIIIDYDAPVNDKEEQYKTYFLSQVDSSDLASLAKGGQKKIPVCVCTEKCSPGKVNMNCPVCAANMTECKGKEPERPKPEDVREAPSEPEKPAKKPKVNYNVVAALAVLLAGGGAALYRFKFRKNKQDAQAAADPDDYDYVENDDEEKVEDYEFDDDDRESNG